VGRSETRKSLMASDDVQARQNSANVQESHGASLLPDTSISATTQAVAVDRIEPGDRIWCPVDVDLVDPPQPVEVDFWDYFSAPPASPPRTASGRSKGMTTFNSTRRLTNGVLVDPKMFECGICWGTLLNPVT
jgi:hypothetical protein